MSCPYRAISSEGIFLIQIAVNKIFSLLFIIFYVKILLTKITRKGVNFMITVSINAHPDIEDKINNYVKENNINLNQVMLDLILEKIEDEEDYKLAVEAYEEYKSNKEKAISFDDLVKKWDWKMKYKVIIRRKTEKQLNKLDDSMKLKNMWYIKQNLNNTDNPKKFGKALRYNLKGFWRYRVENYRIIVKIEKYELVILIVQIDKKDKIYI